MRLFALAGFSLFALAAAAAPAAASTTITGGNVVNQTWNAAGSPYIVQGDVTVPAGAFLTIEAGTAIQLANGDMQGSGTDTARVELIVKGTLTIDGTAQAPVTFGGQTATKGAWYGIEIDATATAATIAHAQVSDAIYGLSSAAPGTVLAVSGSTFADNQSAGVRLSAGAPTLDGIAATGNSSGVYLDGSAAPTLTNSVLRNNTSYGLYDAVSTSGLTIAVSNCTLNSNGSYGIYVNSQPGTVAVVGSIVTNTNYGVRRYGGATIDVSYSDVWGNNYDYSGSSIVQGAGNLSSNPLYTSGTNLHLTSRSPARFGAMGGGDMGALPHTGTATPGLYGTLWVDTTLDAAGSPYTAAGDLSVAPGVTLTIEPGVTLHFMSSDVMAAGTDPSRGELQVAGTLIADGTPQGRITIGASTAASGAWYGVELLATATGSVIDQATIEYGVNGVRYEATDDDNTISHTTLAGNQSSGLLIGAGAPTLDAITASGNSSGVYVQGSAAPVLTNCVLRNNTSYGYYDAVSTAGLTLALKNCTLNANGSYGVYVNSQPGTVQIVNTIVTNTNYGIRRYGGATIDVSYSDVWGNNYDYSGSSIVQGAGNLSANPLYVSATDLHLQTGSVCIDAGTSTGVPTSDAGGVTRPLDGDGINGAAWDVGAYEVALTQVCGDGAVEPGETCDSGTHNGEYGYCNADCSGPGPRCGDGMVQAGMEACDDGNKSNTDGCLNTCVKATCGDGFVWAVAEQCDDGNQIDTDGCTNACAIARCGDGVVQTGVEECDDGNNDDSDGCVGACVAATCGDGYVEAGVEGCDDGNRVDTDACTNACVSATCGDGVVQPGVEECDDGNQVDTDACREHLRRRALRRRRGRERRRGVRRREHRAWRRLQRDLHDRGPGARRLDGRRRRHRWRRRRHRPRRRRHRRQRLGRRLLPDRARRRRGPAGPGRRGRGPADAPPAPSLKPAPRDPGPGARARGAMLGGWPTPPTSSGRCWCRAPTRRASSRRWPRCSTGTAPTSSTPTSTPTPIAGMFFQRIRFDLSTMTTDRVALEHGLGEVAARFAMTLPDELRARRSSGSRSSCRATTTASTTCCSATAPASCRASSPLIVSQPPRPGPGRRPVRRAVPPPAGHRRDPRRPGGRRRRPARRRRRRPGRPRPLHADPERGASSPASPAASSTSTTRSCPPSSAATPTARPTSAASSSSAPPPTTSPPTSTRARSSSRAWSAPPTATRSPTSPARAATSRRSSSPPPSAGTSRTASSPTPARPSSSTEPPIPGSQSTVATRWWLAPPASVGSRARSRSPPTPTPRTAARRPRCTPEAAARASARRGVDAGLGPADPVVQVLPVAVGRLVAPRRQIRLRHLEVSPRLGDLDVGPDDRLVDQDLDAAGRVDPQVADRDRVAGPLVVADGQDARVERGQHRDVARQELELALLAGGRQAVRRLVRHHAARRDDVDVERGHVRRPSWPAPPPPCGRRRSCRSSRTPARAGRRTCPRGSPRSW